MEVTFWQPTREWEGQAAFLIGGGPSLKGFDFSLLAGRNVIGCNDAFHLGPEVISICVFGDSSWWQKNRHALEKFTGRIVTNSPTVVPFNLPNIKKMGRVRHGLGTGAVLAWNYSTGALAINLAVSLGASRIYLLGYDLCNTGGASHWHVHNPKTTQEFAFQRFLKGFQAVKENLPAGITVVNVTDGTSRLQCFEKISFQTFRSAMDGETRLVEENQVRCVGEVPCGPNPGGPPYHALSSNLADARPCLADV